MKWPSSQVRETFVNYFLRHSSLPHIHVPSSSIVPPRKDPSLAFVNAGMNQFKDVILGLGRPPNERVTNSQKCLRINDLSLVGVDTYHHTFFEMLGNWSFANYFKAEACQMAWDLLTNVYKLNPNRLYVTYYAGGNSIPMDEETKRIWEMIGIPKDRILPFAEENFWAMGPIGPCGPSTEIHYDHRGTITDPTEVNKESGNVVEVWNLVFMQYNRAENGSLERLPLSHVVDTGAGLERLTAVLNGKVSNYDTDLFIPIFDCVHNLSKVPKYSGSFTGDAELDKSYRQYADHIRAITVALSDGILPQTNHKIRKLIQRSLFLTEKQFIPHLKSPRDLANFLQESVHSVATTLSKVYPETEAMKGEICEILTLEAERYHDANKEGSSKNVNDVVPNMLVMDFPSLGRIKKSDLERVKAAGVLDGQQAFKWYDSHGVTEEAAEELCQSLGLKFDKEGLNQETTRVKKGFRDEIAKQVHLNSEFNLIRKIESYLCKYKPEDAGGICKPELTLSNEDPVFVEWIFDTAGEPVEEFTGCDQSFWVILSKTIFIPGSPNLSSDIGAVVLQDGSRLNVTNVKMLPSGWILHLVSDAPSSGFKRKTKIRRFESDNSKVFGREVSAQAIRYLQHWLFKQFGVVRFTDGFVSDVEIRLDFTLLKGEIGSKEIRQLQEDLNQYGIPLVVTKRVKKKAAGEFQLVCATGVSAEITNRHGFEATELLDNLEKLCNTHTLADDAVQEEIKSICAELHRCCKSKDITFPFDVYKLIEEGLEKAEKLVQKNDEAEEIRKFAEELTGTEEPFVLKVLESDNEFSSLKKLTRMAEQKPVLVLVVSSDGFVQGRCSIPESLTSASDSLSAKDWMSCITQELGTGSVNAPKGQNPQLAVNLKRVRVADAKTKIESALEKAEEYIIDHCSYVKVLEVPREGTGIPIKSSSGS